MDDVGDTTFSKSKSLINRVNSSTESPTLRELLKNLILSRAKSPATEPNENFDVSELTKYKESKLPYLEKIFHLVNSGFNNDIDKLIV